MVQLLGTFRHPLKSPKIPENPRKRSHKSPKPRDLAQDFNESTPALSAPGVLALPLAPAI
jgi:hypothetical protein